MEGWNRSRHVTGHRNRRPSRPPLPRPDYGHSPVPLWEREFCYHVGGISWKKFCQNKQCVSPFNDLSHWDDSGALENFQNAKARFWAYYHGQPSDIPLPDPDMYIDKVDHDCKVDPELVSDLGLPYESGNNSATATEADKKVAQNQSGNWDMNIEKPAESNNSGLDLTSIPDSTWEMKPKSFPVWGDSNYGWSDAPGDPSWYYSSNNHYPSNNWNVLNAGSNNGFQEWSNKSGRKHNGGHFQHRNSRQRNQTEGYQRSGWQDHRGRHSEWRPVQNRDRQNGQGADRGF